MSTQSVAQCASSLRSLSSTASTLRRTILDTEPKVEWIDGFASTHFRKQWAENRERYNNILYASDTAAAKLAATIKYYLSLQGDMKQPDAVDDMIAEIGALSVKLQRLDFDQSADLSSLKTSFELITRGLTAAFDERERAISIELGAAHEEVAALDQQLKEINAQIRKDTEEATRHVVSRTSATITSLFGHRNKGSEAAVAEEAAPEADTKDRKTKERKAAELARSKAEAIDHATKMLSGGGGIRESHEAQRRDIQERLEIAQARLIRATSAARASDRGDLDAVLHAEREIQRGLDTVIEHLKMFPNVTQQLNKQTVNYLNALETFKADSKSKTAHAELR
ncbi:hypothetical protein C8Q73DRAFT_668772 [Cubamyces lactineus]|nr:hypothetical protein C8Q73DRAFT_668772 [Cubamyces lactineus]